MLPVAAFCVEATSGSKGKCLSFLPCLFILCTPCHNKAHTILRNFQKYWLDGELLFQIHNYMDLTGTVRHDRVCLEISVKRDDI